jgi:hypothetical protein
MSSVRPAYRFVDNASSSNSNDFGNYILKRGMGEVRRPTWNRTVTVVRFLPQWNFEENRWEPFRRSPAPMDLGDWIRRYDAVRGFGENGVTFLLYDPIVNNTYDIQSNPCVILYRAINNAIDNRTCEPDWPALLKGGQGRRALLSRHQPIYIARAGIFCIKSKDMATSERAPLGLAASDPAYFMELPKTAGERLVSLLEERVEGFQGDPEDYDGLFKNGDIVSLDKGAYVTMFEEGADPRKETSAYQQGAAPRQLTVATGGRGNYAASGGSSQFKGYDMYVEKTWRGFSAALNTPELEQLIKSKQRPWEDCLQFFSHQEQAFLVQDGFPPSAILYAWRDHPEWIKDETRSKAVNRTSVSIDPRGNRNNDSFRGPAQGEPTQASRPNQPGWGGVPAVRPPTGDAPTTGAAAGAVRDNSELAKGSRAGEGPTSAPADAPKQAPTGTVEAVAAAVATDQNLKKVGGWGNSAWSPDDTKEGNKDTVVPGSLPDTTGVDNVLSGAMNERERKALEALEAAKQRAAGRS